MTADAIDPFVGRDRERSELALRLRNAQIVSVVGPPGVGKSRLVRQALAELGAGSVWLNLRDVRSPAEVLIPEGRSSVVVLDDFDALVPFADEVVAPLRGSKVVVTSRQRLSLTDEQVLHLGALSPDDAVVMFESAAQGADPDYDPARHREVVRELVERLDRNPLEIRLAAARLPTFTPQDVLDRLDKRFALLGKELAQSLERSFALLQPDELECLLQCGVFRGGFDLAAAEAVVELAPDAEWVFDVIESLVEKSLVVREQTSLRLYESVRDYAATKRAADAEVMARHADYYLGAALRGAAPLTRDALLKAAGEVENLEAVVERFLDGEPARAAAAAVGASAVFRHFGPPARYLRLLEDGVGAARAAGDASALAKLLTARAELALTLGRMDDVDAYAREGAELARAQDYRAVAARAEVQQAEAARRSGDAAAGLERLAALRRECADESRRYIEAHVAACLVDLGRTGEAREIALHIAGPSADGDAADEYEALKRLAYVHYYLANYEHQHQLNREALELAQRVGDRAREARARQGLGDSAFARRDYEGACTHYREARSVHRELGNRHLEAVLVGNLGGAEHRLGELEAAATHYEESLAMHRQTGARPYESVVTFALGALEHERGHLDDAAFRYERAVELFEELGQPEDVVATTICRSWLELERGATAEAEELLVEAAKRAPEMWLAVIQRTQVSAGLNSENFEPVGSTASLPGLLAAALDGAADTDELRETLQGRLVLRFIAVMTERRTTSREPELEIGVHGSWFQLRGSKVVNLRRRRAHKLILDKLMTLYEKQPGKALDVYDAFDVGWPNETAEPEVAAERVYWVVGVLRRLGLEGLLLTSDAGYYLDPTRDVRRATVQKV